MSDYKDPHVRVTWEDYPENFTQENIRIVTQHFQRKYGIRHIHLLTSPVVNYANTKLTSLDITENISDFEYQKKLMVNFVNENNIKVNMTRLDQIDDRINKEVEAVLVNKIRYNKWYLKNIRFSNFLSFGEDNFIDFERLEGITVVESNPRNFGGKSAATIDLLLFLFFNRTTRTKSNIEVFNRFSDKDVVEVKGELNIDGIEYAIERKLTRKRSRSGDYKITNVLNFIKYENGEVINLEGEQRRETEKTILSAIGSEADFLSTILTTGNNLEELIESLPTKRGQILTKFLGLENLRIKDDVARKIYNDWARSLVGNSHKMETLDNNLEEYRLSITESEDEMRKLKDEITANEKVLEELEKRKEEVLSSKNNDVDKELIKTNPIQLQKEIDDVQAEIDKKQQKVDEIAVVEPSKFYLEEEHQLIINQKNDITVKGKSLASEIERQEKLVKEMKEGTICPTCKRPLDDVNHDDEIKEIEDKITKLRKEKDDVGVKYLELLKKDKEFTVIKTEFDTYEKNKVLRERYELEVEQKKHEKSIKVERLAKYDSNKKKMEENQRIEAELLTLRTKIETTKANIKQNDGLIIKHSNNIVLMGNKIIETERIVEQIKKDEKLDEVFKIYLSIFGKNGIAKEIFKNIVPLLNHELHQLLSESSNFIVELRVNEKHDIEFVMIDIETRIEKPLEMGSGYEKTIASLALRSVLTKVSSLPKPNIVVMDEVFGKIADENLDLIGEFFKKIRSYFDHILVISHNPLIRNWSDNVIMIKKEENISSIDFITTNIL